jgi:hypothetical protein
MWPHLALKLVIACEQPSHRTDTRGGDTSGTTRAFKLTAISGGSCILSVELSTPDGLLDLTREFLGSELR